MSHANRHSSDRASASGSTAVTTMSQGGLETLFRRLLGDYERLTNNETTALRAQDFAAVDDTQSRKALLLLSLQELGRKLGAEGWPSRCGPRLEKVIAEERANQTLVAQLLTENLEERRLIDAARSRIRGLSHAYQPVDLPDSARSFFARG